MACAESATVPESRDLREVNTSKSKASTEPSVDDDEGYGLSGWASMLGLGGEGYTEEELEAFIEDKWTIFEDVEDEVEYLRRRGNVLSKGLLRARDELIKLHEAGVCLQEAYETMQRDYREAVGDGAYWRALAEARAEDLQAAQAPAKDLQTAQAQSEDLQTAQAQSEDLQTAQAQSEDLQTAQAQSEDLQTAQVADVAVHEELEAHYLTPRPALQARGPLANPEEMSISDAAAACAAALAAAASVSPPPTAAELCACQVVLETPPLPEQMPSEPTPLLTKFQASPEESAEARLEREQREQREALRAAAAEAAADAARLEAKRVQRAAQSQQRASFGNTQLHDYHLGEVPPLPAYSCQRSSLCDQPESPRSCCESQYERPWEKALACTPSRATPPPSRTPSRLGSPPPGSDFSDGSSVLSSAIAAAQSSRLKADGTFNVGSRRLLFSPVAAFSSRKTIAAAGSPVPKQVLSLGAPTRRRQTGVGSTTQASEPITPPASEPITPGSRIASGIGTNGIGACPGLPRAPVIGLGKATRRKQSTIPAANSSGCGGCHAEGNERKSVGYVASTSAVTGRAGG